MKQPVGISWRQRKCFATEFRIHKGEGHPRRILWLDWQKEGNSFGTLARSTHLSNLDLVVLRNPSLPTNFSTDLDPGQNLYIPPKTVWSKVKTYQHHPNINHFQSPNIIFPVAWPSKARPTAPLGAAVARGCEVLEQLCRGQEDWSFDFSAFTQWKYYRHIVDRYLRYR